MTHVTDQPGETGIEVARLTRRFGKVTAVNDVSFSIQAGEIVGLLGPNGAGKSTMMRVLAGYLPPSRGTVRIAGRDVVTNSLAARRSLGYLPEHFALYQDMPVYDYLKYRARLKGLHGRSCRKRVLSVLEQCDLESVVGKHIATLSRGYRQRVGLADALVNDPPALILDEPGLGLDPNQLSRLRTRLQETGQHRAVLVSSHGLSEIERLCGRVLIISAGCIVAVDTPARLIDRWRGRSRFVIEVRGNVGAFLQGCRDLASVTKATIETADVWSRLYLEAEKEADLGGDLFNLAIANDCILREIRRERDRLDDVFAAMTATEEC